MLYVASQTTRSIPACAGEPSALPVASLISRVYPRVCGGTSPSLIIMVIASGLSPRVRGNRRCGRPGQPHPGSIPACAGEPWSSRVRTRMPSVYPRVCGGTRWLSASAPPGARSIPACAGEPTAKASKLFVIGVYPRVCGGTETIISNYDGARGLSPRVRGNLTRSGWKRTRTRSIPACAGEPKAQNGRCCPMQVYPRVCGGTA